jgi:hypothetical protein
MSNARAAQLVEAGMWLRLSGDQEGARRLFEQALRLDPDNARARQLLESPATGPVPPPPAAPPPEPAPAAHFDNPFAPAPSSTAADLDWGSATGFSLTPLPIIPPVAKSVPRPLETDLPIEVDIDSSASEVAVPTLVFGLSAQGGPAPEPPPTEPETWAPSRSADEVLFEPGEAEEEVPWAVTPEAANAPTMEFPRPPVPIETMEFPRPAATIPEPNPTADDDWGSVELDLEFVAPAVPTIAPVVPAAALRPAPMPMQAIPPPPPSEPKFAPNATSAWDQRSNPGISIQDVAPAIGDALDLVTVNRPQASSPTGHKQAELKTLVRGAKDLLNLDDHTGAMDLILKAQELAPNDAEVQALRDRSERTLEAMFESKLGKLSGCPRVKLKDDEIIWLNLDHRAGFVLAQIDGSVTFEDLFSVSGMSRLDTARILAQLIEEGVIIH